MTTPTQSNLVASPGSFTGSSDGSGKLSSRDIELQRKRARDRKSQQAMRDRTKWTIANLSEQIAFLTQILDQKNRDVGLLDTQVRILETENAHLRTQNAALQLSLLGSCDQVDIRGTLSGPTKNPWELPPLNSPPSCICDQILQRFLLSKGKGQIKTSAAKTTLTRACSPRPNICSLMDKDHRSEDDISNVAGDIIRSFSEINTLPKKIAVFYIMFTITKWMFLLDQESWIHMPTWLRPTRVQLSTAHAAWIDRIPWPKAREYLVAHPEITYDDFAATYSTSFSISWPYDPSLVLIPASDGIPHSEHQNINPVFEEHMRQLRNWTVGNTFRKRWPELAAIIDSYPCPP
ncbi:hypothetical protein F5Y19DRAFT_478570 [Xylariaceae sp. FL1651]|nr:hypothetical protein F5Y19DRAFT_478570 [Xylariaceae sp. FL1651]